MIYDKLRIPVMSSKKLLYINPMPVYFQGKEIGKGEVIKINECYLRFELEIGGIRSIVESVPELALLNSKHLVKAQVMYFNPGDYYYILGLCLDNEYTSHLIEDIKFFEDKED